MTESSPDPLSVVETERALARAVCLSGSDYLQAESALRGGGAVVATQLRTIAAGESDTLVRFVAVTIADWMDEPSDELTLALQEIDKLERAKRGTPSPGPRPDVIELALSEEYEARIAPYLALRLLKEDWPDWKVMGCLLYLEYQRVPATAPALALLALKATDLQERELALSALAATVGEPAVDARLDDARTSLARLRAADPMPP